MKILLVDDDPSSGDQLTEAFTIKNYVVNLVTDGETALKIARSCPYNLIVVNLLTKGIRVCELLRSNGYNGSIMMMSKRTGEAADAECAQSLLVGANDCMTQNEPIPDVLEHMNQLLYHPAI